MMSRVKLWIRRCLVGFLGLMGLALIGGAIFIGPQVPKILKFNPFMHAVFGPSYPKPANQAEAYLQDLDYLKTELMSLDRSFTDDQRARFREQITAMETRAGTMTDAEFVMGISKAIAISDNGHTSPSYYDRARLSNRIPLRFFWFDDGLYVTQAHEGLQQYMGKRVVAIEGRDPVDLLDEIDRYQSGIDEWVRYYSPWLFESPELMHAISLAAKTNSLTVTFGDDNETRWDLVLTADPASRWATLSPWEALKPISLETGTWHSVLEGKNPPRYLDDVETYFQEKELPGNGRYIRMEYMYPRKGQDMEGFIKETEKDLATNRPAYVVVDLRFNPGGDYTLVADFMTHLPGYLPDDGTLYVITGNGTFSAALVSVAILNARGGEKTVIVGQHMGDKETFWAERGVGLSLPNSGIRINYATGYHDWSNGCAGKHPHCFTPNEPYEAKNGSLAPDVPLPFTFSDYAAGKDAVMEYILDKESRAGPNASGSVNSRQSARARFRFPL